MEGRLLATERVLSWLTRRRMEILLPVFYETPSTKF